MRHTARDELRCGIEKDQDTGCYDLAVVIVRLGLLGGLLSFDETLKDVHNVENQWLKQVSDLKRV